MKRIFSALFFCFFIIANIISLSACGYNGYRGEYEHLLVTACVNVMGTRGYWFGTTFKDPVIIPLEKDEQGRELFVYWENTDRPISIIVCQYSDSNKVYFYQDCFIVFAPPEEVYDLYEKKLSHFKVLEIVNKNVTTEQLNDLKQKNDWGKELQLNKCESAPIKKYSAHVFKGLNRKGELPFDEKDFKEIYIKYVAEFAPKSMEYEGDIYNLYQVFNIDEKQYIPSVWFDEFLFVLADNYGREMYFIDASIEYIPEKSQTNHTIDSITCYYDLVMIFQPDGTYLENVGIIAINEPYDYIDQIKKIKLDNGWNMPIKDGEQ